MFKADNWTGLMERIKDSEEVCDKLAQDIDSFVLQTAMPAIQKAMTEHLSRLEDLLMQSREDLLETRQCFDSVYTSDYQLNKDKNQNRVPGTCEWFLRHQRYKAWLDGGSSLLWVSADPGCGKSVLSRFLVDDELRAKASPDTIICYFFFKDDNTVSRSAIGALCALLHQIFMQNGDLLRYAMPCYRRTGTALHQRFDDLWEVLMLAAAKCSGSIICVLDALDECEQSTRLRLIKKLTNYYSRSQARNGLKVIITSRPYMSISDALFYNGGLDRDSVQLMGESKAEMDEISNEIDLFIKEKVKAFQNFRRWKKVYDDAHIILQTHLDSIVNRTYLWVSLIFPELEMNVGASKAKLQRIIKTLPGTIYEAYDRILHQSSDPKEAKKLLQIVVAAFRPLSLKEMNMALAIRAGDSSVDDVELTPESTFEGIVRELCGLFVTIINENIYLVHQTAKEFLQTRPEDTRGSLDSQSWKHSLIPSESHMVMAKACMWYLRFNAFGSDPLSVIEPQRITKYIGDNYFLGYAARYWAFHYERAEKDNDVLTVSTNLCHPQSKRWKIWFAVYLLLSREVESPILEDDLVVRSYFGHVDAVKMLLDNRKKSDINIRNNIHALHVAVSAEHEEVVSLLLEAQVNFEAD
jgi:ankyrin repeat domain-containing protein 50